MYSKEVILTDLARAEINGVDIVMREIQLRQLLKAHEELVKLGIGVAGKLGFVSAPETTCSWRSYALQQQLVAKGASKTLASHHRRGVAVDCYADWDYIKRIKATMNKYGFYNDLAYVSKDWSRASDTQSATTPTPWDGGHWNWISNLHAYGYTFINDKPNPLKAVSMTEYENSLVQLTQGGHEESGTFALVLKGKKWRINTNMTKKSIEAIFTIMMRGMAPHPLTIAAWNSIPDGEGWEDYK